MSKQISCIITDDEPMARRGLEGYVRQFPFLHLIGSCESALELQEKLLVKKPDLLLLDIEMPYLSGIDLIKSLEQPPKVIFTTAYEQFALTGFDLDVLDYLLKPISLERFTRAMEKAQDYFENRNRPDALFIRVDGTVQKILVEDIVYVEALENYVAFYTTHQPKLITHATLKSVLNAIPHFFQVHKSYVVNPRKITAVLNNHVVCGTVEIPVSRMKVGALKKIIGDAGIHL